MRKLIIDTDTGSDDAVAVIMALRDTNTKVLAVTTVFGNIAIDIATRNALISIEKAKSYFPPVYQGMAKPLASENTFAHGVHGVDGLGDVGYADPVITAESEHAVDAIIRLIKENPNEIEICTIGRLTNIAMVALREPETLKLVKKITIMGGSFPEFTKWFTPIGEANIKGDVEAANIVMESGVPIVMVPINACRGETVTTKEEMDEMLATGSNVAKFCIECNRTLIDLNKARFGVECIDQADASAMAVCLCPECVDIEVDAYCTFETEGKYSRGAMIFYLEGNGPNKPNCKIVKTLKADVFKEFLFKTTV